MYVGRPSRWGNPWPVAGEMQPWLALALGQHGNGAGRRASAVIAFRWWMADDGSRFPVPSETSGVGGDIEYADGTVRHISDIPVAMGVMMLARFGTIGVPSTRPDLAPLRGHDLACWCPEPCGVEVALYAVAYGDLYEPCAKPRGHEGNHDPSEQPIWCHADVLLELANA